MLKSSVNKKSSCVLHICQLSLFFLEYPSFFFIYLIQTSFGLRVPPLYKVKIVSSIKLINFVRLAGMMLVMILSLV